jgi:SAM-dependent methyltransferase
MQGQPTAGTSAPPERVLGVLPGGWSLGTGSALDFDAELAETPSPPLAHPDGSFALIWSEAGFTRLDSGWAEWLLELRRLLAAEGLLVVGLSDPADFERLTDTAWDDSSIGMTALSALNGTAARRVFHSEWWLRAHWGRAFEVVAIREEAGRWAVLRGTGGPMGPEDLERPEHGEERELAAAAANAELLRAQLGILEGRYRRELEEANRELLRRSFTAAELEWARGGPGSPAALVAAEYEATTSWKLTRPLRALGALLRRLR